MADQTTGAGWSQEVGPHFCGHMVDSDECKNVHEPHPYTVDTYLHGTEPYPCVICGRPRNEH